MNTQNNNVSSQDVKKIEQENLISLKLLKKIKVDDLIDEVDKLDKIFIDNFQILKTAAILDYRFHREIETETTSDNRNRYGSSIVTEAITTRDKETIITQKGIIYCESEYYEDFVSLSRKKLVSIITTLANLYNNLCDVLEDDSKILPVKLIQPIS